MRVCIYEHSLEHAKPALVALGAGLRRHGIEPMIREARGGPVSCDVAVFWGHRRREIMAHQRQTGGRYLVVERAYLGDRFRQYSLGYDGLNGRADFCLGRLDAADLEARWQRHWRDLEVAPWRSDGRYALLLGQVPGDASLQSVHEPTSNVDLDQLYSNIVKVWRGPPIVFRRHPHPGAAGMQAPCKEIEGSLSEALSGAAVAIAWNSNALVDAVLAGVPVIALDGGSMARDVASHDLEAYGPKPGRARWARRLAWCQWTMGEIEDGEAWVHLRHGVR